MMRAMLLSLMLSPVSAFASEAEEAGVETAALSYLHAAAAQAEIHAADRYAFTLRQYASNNDEAAVSIVARFDPRLPEGERWTLLTDGEEKPDKPARKMFEKLAKSGHSDDALIYDRLDEILSGAALIEETDERAVFSTKPEIEDLPAGAVIGEIVFDKAADHVSRIEIRSVEAFKPNGVVKVEEMRQLQLYERHSESGPAFLASSESKAAGKAMLTRFDTRTRMEYFDIERVEAEARDAVSE